MRHVRLVRILAILALAAMPSLGLAQVVAAVGPSTQALLPIERHETIFQALNEAVNSQGIAAIRRDAASGKAEAIYLLALSKAFGVEGPIDVVEARSMIRRAALLGHRRAVASLGSFMTFGWGGPKSESEGIALLEDAVAMGSPQAMLMLGDYFAYDARSAARDPVRARELYLRADALGYVTAKVALADLQWFGVGQVPALAQALPVYEAEAANGSPRALLRLGYAHRTGTGVQMDKPRALGLFRDAMRLGALGALPAAEMLISGDGVSVDVEEAARLLLLETNRGAWPATAQYAKLVLERKVSSQPGRDTEAAAVAADEHGFPEALNSLLRNLREGVNGYAQDLKRAAELARPALARAEARSATDEVLWPLFVKGIAYTLQKALEQDVAEAFPGERQSLADRYGPASGGLLKVSVTVTCLGVPQPFEVYLWRAFSVPLPTDAQFNWLEKTRGCLIDPEVVLSFRRVYMRAKVSGASLKDEFNRQLEAKDRLRQVLKPIEI